MLVQLSQAMACVPVILLVHVAQRSQELLLGAELARVRYKLWGDEDMLGSLVTAG